MSLKEKSNSFLLCLSSVIRKTSGIHPRACEEFPSRFYGKGHIVPTDLHNYPPQMKARGDEKPLSTPFNPRRLDLLALPGGNDVQRVFSKPTACCVSGRPSSRGCPFRPIVDDNTFISLANDHSRLNETHGRIVWAWGDEREHCFGVCYV